MEDEQCWLCGRPISDYPVIVTEHGNVCEICTDEIVHEVSRLLAKDGTVFFTIERLQQLVEARD